MPPPDWRRTADQVDPVRLVVGTPEPPCDLHLPDAAVQFRVVGGQLRLPPVRIVAREFLFSDCVETEWLEGDVCVPRLYFRVLRQRTDPRFADGFDGSQPKRAGLLAPQACRLWISQGCEQLIVVQASEMQPVKYGEEFVLDLRVSQLLDLVERE